MPGIKATVHSSVELMISQSLKCLNCAERDSQGVKGHQNMTLGRNSALGSQSIALKPEVKNHPGRDALTQELCQPPLTDQGWLLGWTFPNSPG